MAKVYKFYFLYELKTQKVQEIQKNIGFRASKENFLKLYFELQACKPTTQIASKIILFVQINNVFLFQFYNFKQKCNIRV